LAKTKQSDFAETIRTLARQDCAPSKDCARLLKRLKHATPATVHASEAAFELGIKIGEGSAALIRQLKNPRTGRPADDEARLYWEIQCAAERFFEPSKNRGLRPRFQDIADHWDRTCGFPLTRQKFTAWRKSGVGFVFCGEGFKYTGLAGRIRQNNSANNA
jgi:hypothetical protein